MSCVLSRKLFPLKPGRRSLAPSKRPKSRVEKGTFEGAGRRGRFHFAYVWQAILGVGRGGITGSYDTRMLGELT